MKQDIILIISLIVLNIGLFGIFFAKDIIDRSSNLKGKLKAVRVSRVVGFIVVIVALCAIYFCMI